MNYRLPMARWEHLLVSGPVAATIAAAIVIVIGVGAVMTLRTGRWPFRLILMLSALLWPLPDHPLQGPVVLKISYLHGIHLADLLSIVAVAVAVVPWHRLRTPGASHSRRTWVKGRSLRPAPGSQDR